MAKLKNSIKGRLLLEKETNTHVFVDPSINTPGFFICEYNPRLEAPYNLKFYGPTFKGHTGYKLKAFSTMLTKAINGRDSRMWVESQVVDGRTKNANSILKCAMSSGAACASNTRLPPTMVPLGWKGNLIKGQMTEQICYVWQKLYGTDLKELCLYQGVKDGTLHNTIDAVGLFLNAIGEIGK